MPLQLPKLSQFGIDRFAACGVAFLPAKHALVKWVADNKINGDAQYGDDGDWFHVMTSLWPADDKGNSRVHLHIDLASNAFFSNRKKSEPNADMKRLLEVVKKFKDVELDSDVECVFQIQRSELPLAGVVRTLLDFTIKSQGAKLNLSGVKMSIEDGDFSAVSWGESAINPDAIRATIFFERDAAVSDDYLMELAKESRTGIDRFVLEKKHVSPKK